MTFAALFSSYAVMPSSQDGIICVGERMLIDGGDPRCLLLRVVERLDLRRRKRAIVDADVIDKAGEPAAADIGVRIANFQR